jgi:hypothetical protein
LDLVHQGSTFFDGWTFVAPDEDYTHGTFDTPFSSLLYSMLNTFYILGVVQYLAREAATVNLAVVDPGTNSAIMKVDTTPVVAGNRPSVRIEDNYKFNAGTIVIMDATVSTALDAPLVSFSHTDTNPFSQHMPVGCGTWPAWWTNGPDWPAGGEIDIIEGVHNNVDNLSSLHTNDNCSIYNDGNASGIMGSSMSCAWQPGCGFTNPSSNPNQANNYGAGFNANKGGVYAMRWLDTGISMWFFPRGVIPADITGDAPNPAAWGKPYASFPFGDQCSGSHFRDHNAIFDT